MSRPRRYQQAAELKRMTPDHFPDAGNMVDDDTDESEWDDVSGYGLGGDEDEDDAESR